MMKLHKLINNRFKFITKIINKLNNKFFKKPTHKLLTQLNQQQT